MARMTHLGKNEKLAEKRVMRHRGVSRVAAQEFITERLRAGKSVGGFNKPTKPKSNAPAREAQRKRMVEHRGNITNRPAKPKGKKKPVTPKVAY